MMRNDRWESFLISRRQFVSGIAAAGVGLSLVTKGKGASKNCNKPRPICVFSKHLQWLDYDSAAELAAESGLDGVDVTVRPGGHVHPENVTQDLPRAVKAIEKAGLICPMITTAITGPQDFLAEKILKTAVDLGIQYYRMGYLDYDDEAGIAQTLERLKPRIAGLAELNRKCGLHGAYQNHSGMLVGGPVWDIWELLKGLDPKVIGCQYDIRHAVVEGGTCWPLGLKLLLPYIKCMVIKDFKWGQRNDDWKVINCPVGEGMVDFSAYFEILNKVNIQGPFSLHLEYQLPGEDLALRERKRAFVSIIKKELRTLKGYML